MGQHPSLPPSDGGRRASKAQSVYRLTEASLVWIGSALILIPYELLQVSRGEPGGPLTHVVKWAYGPEYSARWWLVGWSFTGFLAWLIPHFLWEGWGIGRLGLLVGVGLLIGLIGWALT